MCGGTYICALPYGYVCMFVLVWESGCAHPCAYMCVFMCVGMGSPAQGSVEGIDEGLGLQWAWGAIGDLAPGCSQLV